MVKLKSLCKNYVEENFWLAQSTRETTKRAYKYFAQAVGNITIDRLEFRHFEKFKSWLLKSGRSKTTVNIYLRSLRPVLNWAIQLKLLESNPMVGVKEIKTTRRPIRIYEDWETERMLRYCPNDRWRAIILCARTTGLRRGAILNLTWGNIRKGFVYVEPKRDTKSTWPWEPKDKEIRKVPLVEPLEMLLERMEGKVYPFLPPKRYKNLLALKEAGMLDESMRKCPEQNFRRTFVGIQRRAFGRQIGDFHSLRKTFTTLMCEELPEHFVMRLTGHNSLKTMTYYLASRESYYDIARKTAVPDIKMGHLGQTSPANRGVCNGVPTGRYWT